MSAPQWLFADFRLDAANACLWHGTQAVALTPKAFDVLHYLVQQHERLVPKEHLLDAVWPETPVSDVVVRVAIGEARKALGDTAQAPRFIATVPRRGYRFIAPVTQAAPGTLGLPARPAPLGPPAVPPRAAAVGPGLPRPAWLAQGYEQPQSQVLAHHLTAYLYHRLREPSAVQTHAEAVLTLATTQEWPLYVGLANHLRGWAVAMQGQGEAGMAQMHQGLAGILATGQALAQSFCLALMAEAAGYTGHVDQGLHLLTEAHAAFEGSGRGDMLTEAYRLQGELLLRQVVPDPAQAAVCFQQALRLARQQQAKSWELRAAMSLARLWQQQGQRAAAHVLLADIYGWFTEGLDTADLREAKQLLAALA